jgi:hypothetical protein
MATLEIEKGDVIAIKDGRDVRVLSVYKPSGSIIRVDCIDDREASPMRFPVFSKDIVRILKKHEAKKTDNVKIPAEQVVQEKEETPVGLKEDVAGRKTEKTAAAEAKTKGGK